MCEKCIPIARVRQLSTRDGYFRAFRANKTPYNSIKSAYQQTEQEFRTIFGRPKYRSYKSFKTVKSRLAR